MQAIYTQLIEHAQEDGERPALTEYLGKGRYAVVSRAKLASLASFFATYWSRTTANDAVIPIYLERSAVSVAAIIGAIGSQRAFTCINRKHRAAQVDQILRQLPGELVLTDQRAADQAITEHLQYPAFASRSWHVVSSTTAPVESLVVLEKGEIKGAFEDSVLQMSLADPEQPEAALDSRPGCCLFTSGSTGASKGVLIGQSDLLERAQEEVKWFELTASDSLLGLLPFSFDVGLNQLLSAVLAGAELILLHSWLPADIRRVCEDRAVTGISSVPALWRDQIAADIKLYSTNDGAPLRYVTISGGDLDPASLKRLPEIVPGAGIYKTYGQTETFRSSSLHPEEFSTRPRSVGRQFGKARFYVIDANGLPCRAGDSGQIVHTGPGTMLGYVDRSKDEEKIRVNPFHSIVDSASVAVFTGDYGFVDEEGYLYITGRKDDMVKVKGNRVYPQEVVSQLMLVCDIDAAEVIVVQGDMGEPELVAFVQIHPGRDDAPGILRQLRNRVPSYMVPSKVITCVELPKLANGKPDREALKQQARDIMKSVVK